MKIVNELNQRLTKNFYQFKIIDLFCVACLLIIQKVLGSNLRGGEIVYMENLMKLIYRSCRPIYCLV